MNLTPAVLKEQKEDAFVVSYSLPAPMFLNKRLAKKIVKGIVQDFKINKGEDLYVRAFNLDDSFIKRVLGCKHYWQLTRHQTFALRQKLERFIRNKSQPYFRMSYNQATHLRIELVEVKNGL